MFELALEVDVAAGRAVALGRELAEFVAERARFYCPVDSGHLLSTIQVVEAEDGRSWRVVATAEYASAVEFGYTTSTGRAVPPQPFLRPAIADGRRWLAERARGR